ncbi:MAG: aminopeptidase, partial [Gemmatimonadaceae bacterium]
MNRTLGVLTLAALLAVTQGCYLARAAAEEARILAGRRSIRELIEDPRLADSVKQKFRVVLAARRFAVDSLGLD